MGPPCMSWREDEEHPKEFDDLLDHEDLDEGESSSVELDSDDEESMEIEELDTSGEEEEEWEENNEEDEVWEENNEKNQKLEPETPGLTPSTPPECRQSVPQMRRGGASDWRRWRGTEWCRRFLSPGCPRHVCVP
ncbi:uncharacterized protein LOC112047914 isoform X5 [Bicyclus anynana]|uniref:Uncharacterized protein LOC112047914 isoform X5 n=1 Tax=Bicyclus anynana TaxID=110368 RepID=A0ABM3LL35_BICAN|nr:uncharacterized protein LOC112047914 isoform X5 [Bicyclus anynana]